MCNMIHENHITHPAKNTTSVLTLQTAIKCITLAKVDLVGGPVNPIGGSHAQRLYVLMPVKKGRPTSFLL